ncbi:deoxyhypusine synthase [Bacteriovorax sp. BSW11_IV]|uniref:deoxyhypusine synthase family protein n=1 Tax=Bacteriovorax sp. BSW11_IV TaxID=1353529 RepID=UPI00038A5291|nr:deoxyhypusine synthase family protein [Bacteriovorax sp. BSW11_IV]EQC42931.1 deoxyhypusine synthase [Bacteriovorax sp. BSW11_IV]
MSTITNFIEHNYRHFNAAALRDAARAYKKHIEDGKPMIITLAGAMSTAELGLSLADMIREGKVQAISCTGANLEEDVFNLVAHNHYERIPNYRNLTEEQEEDLLNRHLNRVTDTCIPEEEAIRRIERAVLKSWQKASDAGTSKFPHEYLYEILLSGELEEKYQIDKKNSWLLAAAEKNLPMIVPGWEDSTLGNIFAGRVIEGKIKRECMKTGIDYMIFLSKWYPENCGKTGIGFFQIGGGIAGDFPICVVPMIEQDLELDVPKWNFFCQISDSTTSYGSYSGAVPNEKITWGKLETSSPKFIIESDATIVAPLIFAYVLGR